MPNALLEVERIDSKKKRVENPALVAYQESLLRDLESQKNLNAEQLKVHELAAKAINTPNETTPKISAEISAEDLPKNSNPFGYNLFSEVYHTLYAPKEELFSKQQLEITNRANEIYRALDHLIQLKQRIRQEKAKNDAGNGKEVAIDSIDFSLPELKGQISLTKKKRVEKSDLTLDVDLAKVLAFHGYNLQELKQQAHGEGDHYVISFDPSVSPKTQTEFRARSKECAALEYLQENHYTEILTKDGKARYDFSKPAKAEKEKLIKSVKELEQVVTNRCEQMPTDANNELTRLQPLQSAQRLTDEAMAETVKASRKLIDRILDRMAAAR